MSTKDDGIMRQFDTGATRDTGSGKIDPEGFLNPLFLLQFSKYMNMHRIQADGTLRDSDNWQKGIPKRVCMKSLKRHVDDMWLIHRGYGEQADEPCIIAAAMGALFNIQAYILQIIEEQGLRDFDGDDPIKEIVERLSRISKDGGAMDDKWVQDLIGRNVKVDRDVGCCTGCLACEKEENEFPCRSCSRIDNGGRDYWNNGF